MIKQNTVAMGLVQTTDLTATILEILLQSDLALYHSLPLDGESLLDPLLSGSMDKFQRKSPLMICTSTEPNNRRPCKKVAIIHPSKPLKLIVPVNTDGTIAKAKSKLYNYEKTEAKVVAKKNFKNPYQQMINQGANFAKNVVLSAKKKCTFPAVQKSG